MQVISCERQEHTGVCSVNSGGVCACAMACSGLTSGLWKVPLRFYEHQLWWVTGSLNRHWLSYRYACHRRGHVYSICGSPHLPRTSLRRGHCKPHRRSCSPPLADRAASAPLASGAESPPVLPAGTSRQPACPSWPIESCLTPENLPVNSGLKRAADRGCPPGPL